MIKVHLYDIAKKREFIKDFYDCYACVKFLNKVRFSKKIRYEYLTCTDNEEAAFLTYKGF